MTVTRGEFWFSELAKTTDTTAMRSLLYFLGVGVVFGIGRGAPPPVAVFWSVGSPGQSLGCNSQQRSS